MQVCLKRFVFGQVFIRYKCRVIKRIITWASPLSKIIPQGFTYEIHVDVSSIIFKAMVSKNTLFQVGLTEGSEVFVSFRPDAIHCL